MFAELGHEVMVGTRDPEATLAKTMSDQPWVPAFGAWASAHADVKVGTFEEAAKHGELLVNATSGQASLEVLGVGTDVVVVERGDVLRAKPEPDLFLACQERMGVHIRDCTVVGDAVWDLLAARRAGMLSVGLLTGGYGEDELGRAGAFRVYRDPAELDASLDELGISP